MNFIEKVFVVAEAYSYPLTQRILNQLQLKPQIVSGTEEVRQEIAGEEDIIKKGKKILVLDISKAKFIKPCPCTPVYLGCGYLVINADLNCPLDCSYCILQSYLDQPWLTVFVNQDQLAQEISYWGHKRKGYFRIGTGELGDSLALDPLTQRSRDLCQMFFSYPQAILELKTKTTSIDLILKQKCLPNVVIAWSLNAEEIAHREEKGAPPVKDRLLAAKEVVKKGYHVAFHFDPLIWYRNWEEGYGQVVEFLMANIPAEKVAWISLGALRFPPQLKAIIKKRFPNSLCLTQEFIRGLDGKYRIFRPLRVEMYRQVMNFFKASKRYQKVKFYLCMESAEVWNEVMGEKKRSERGICVFLSRPLN